MNIRKENMNRHSFTTEVQNLKYKCIPRIRRMSMYSRQKDVYTADKKKQIIEK